MSNIEKLGFIGLGVMGGRMCANLVKKSGMPVFGYDIDAANLSKLVEQGVQAAGSIREVMEQADVVFVCVPGEPQVRAVALSDDGVVAHARPGQTIVDMTTATVEINREVAAALAVKGADFADAPIARGMAAAQNGTLAITVGASPEVFDRIKPLLLNMGTEISHCGEVGNGQVMKLMNNMLVFQNVSALAEAMAIATGAGVEREKVFEILSKGSADSFCMRNHGKCITADTYPDNQFSTVYSLKDLRYALSLAETVGVDAAGAKVVEQRFLEAIDKGYGKFYTPVIYKLHEQDS